jgi:methionyl-tRNA formyltransferase
MKYVFFGTDNFSTIILDELEQAGYLPTLVVSAPDRKLGRGLKLTPPPVKLWATKRNIDILQPEKLDSDSSGQLQATDYDVCIVASYGHIIPQTVLDIPVHGTLNVHPSLLPKYRGASPIESQILADDKNVGVTIMLMDVQMDHGPIVAQTTVDLEQFPLPAPELEQTLAHTGGKLLSTTIPSWLAGTITPQEQEHGAATFTKKIAKADGLIDLTADPYQNWLKFNAFQNWPRSYFFVKKNGIDERVIITAAQFVNGEFLPTHVIPEGKKEMSYTDFLRSR